MEVEKLVRNLSLGQKVILKLPDEIVVGELVVKKIPSHVRLKDCYDYNTNDKLGSNNIYYINEIRDIRVLNDKHEENLEEEKFGEKPAEEEAKKARDKLLTKLTDDKFNHIRQVLDARIFIDRYEVKYFDACREMLKQRQIGVCFEDVRFGRRSKPSILAVSTDSKVYIFDLKLLDGIKKELKAVFESSSVCKIIHYSKMTNDYLKNACNIKVRFIFDPLMAYFYVSGTREVLTISELISKLFNFPCMAPSKDIHWDERPVSKETISQAGFSVGFLIEIQQYLMHRHLLKGFYDASTAAMSQFSKGEEFPYVVKLVNGKEVVKELKDNLSHDESIDLQETKNEENGKSTENETS